MLRAEKSGLMGKRYEITDDGRPVAGYERRWRTGHITVDGAEFTTQFKGLGRRYTLVSPEGGVVAEADGVGRKRWTLRADGVEYRFERPSWLSRSVALMVDGREAGSISRAPGLRRGAQADLPGMSLLLQVFVLSAVVDAWDRQNAASGAAAGGAAASGG